MTTDYNTELREEQDRLSEVVAYIDSEIQTTLNMMPARAAYQPAAEALQKMNEEKIEKLRQARPQPFAGRVDFIPEGKADVERRYLGKHPIQGRVTSWAAPIANLYYDPASGKYPLRVRGVPEEKKATVRLKRTYTIEDAVLYEFSDALRLPAGAPAGALPAPDDTLAGVLSSTGASELEEAIATIQPEQYQQIASTDETVMIIQGAAGSGKSLVGLHRIAYLLSPFNETGITVRPENVVILGPSRAFLGYVRGLLPSLGNRDIQQVTVQDWMLSQFKMRPRVDAEPRALTRTMGRNPLSGVEVRAESFKGSLSMATLLYAYVKKLRSVVAPRVRIGTVQTPLGATPIPSALVAKVVRETTSLPLNAAREAIVSRLVRELWSRNTSISTPREYSDFEAIARKSIEEQLSATWREIDVSNAYLHVMDNPRMLVELGNGTVDAGLAAGLRASLPRQGRRFQSTDVPPLLYLDHLLNDHGAAEYDHIVVDEAQEVSPLEMHLLKRHSRNGWFTILGDLRQRMLPYKGLDSWADLRPVFRSDYKSPMVSRLSYRSTAQITRFANRILRRVQGGTPPPIPYPRNGAYPRLHRSASSKEMHEAIAESVRQAREQSMTVAVLTRNMPDARQTAALLNWWGAEVSLLTPDKEIEGGVTVSPILLTKGLEFDVVIVAGVDTSSFTGSDMDNRLFYLACTRARHALEIHWFGTRSPLLAELGAYGTELGGELEGKAKRSIFRPAPPQARRPQDEPPPPA